MTERLSLSHIYWSLPVYSDEKKLNQDTVGGKNQYGTFIVIIPASSKFRIYDNLHISQVPIQDITLHLGLRPFKFHWSPQSSIPGTENGWESGCLHYWAGENEVWKCQVVEFPQQCSKRKVHLTLHPSSASSLPRRTTGFQKLLWSVLPGLPTHPNPPEYRCWGSSQSGPSPRRAPSTTPHFFPSAGPGQCLMTSAWTEQGPMHERKKQRNTVICYPKSFVIDRKNATNHL